MSIKAPWTPEQVANLNRFQKFGAFHPFTCPGHEGDGDRALVATPDGWICRHCDYRQDWAHASMCAFDATKEERVRESMPAFQL